MAARTAVPAGRWPSSASCHAAGRPRPVIVMVQVSAGPCRAAGGAVTFAAGPAQGVTATPSEPWDGAVTVAGDKEVILPVTGLIANCDRAPWPSLVT